VTFPYSHKKNTKRIRGPIP